MSKRRVKKKKPPESKQFQKISEKQLQARVENRWGIFLSRLLSFLQKMDSPLAWVCLTGIIALSFLISFHTLIDTDIFWHLKTGELIFQTRQVPHSDLFSFTVAGKKWIDSQWLFQLVIYLLYKYSGYPGMILFGAVLSALTWFLILVPDFNSRKYFSRIFLGLIALLTVSIRLKLRPELLTFFYLSLEIFLIFRIKQGKNWALFLLPVLLLFWLNSEGLWPIYFVVLGVFLLEEIISLFDWWLPRSFPKSSSPAFLRELGLILAISLPLSLANPYGFDGVLFPGILFKEITHPGSFLGKIIYEFRNPFGHLPWFDLSAYIILMVCSALFFAVLFYQKRIYLSALFLWGCFIFLSATTLRNVALFGIITISLLQGLLTENQNLELFPFPGLKAKFSRLRPLASIMVLVAIIYLIFDVMSNRFYLRNQTFAQFGIGALPIEYPIRASETLKKFCGRLGERRILKIFSDASSGYLIWAGAPEWKVYVDPRLELYGEEFFKHYLKVLSNWTDFQMEDKKRDFDAVLIAHFRSPPSLFLNLYHSPDWSLVHLDGHSTLFIKKRPEFVLVLKELEIDFSKGYQIPRAEGLIPELGAWEKFNSGRLLLMLEQFELARAELEEAVRLAPENPEYNYYLGATLNLLFRYQEALFYLEKAAHKKPDFALNQIQLARALAGIGKYQDAINIFQELLIRFPEQIYVCMDLAKVYEMVKERDRAYAQWKRCEEISRRDPEGWKSLREEIFQALQRLAVSEKN